MTMIRSQIDTYVKILRHGSVFCQNSGCEEPATHLFLSETIVAYCESHAKEEAVRIGIELPMAATKLPPAGVFPGSLVVPRSSAA
jgi:hypothetical protein